MTWPIVLSTYLRTTPNDNAGNVNIYVLGLVVITGNRQAWWEANKKTSIINVSVFFLNYKVRYVCVNCEVDSDVALPSQGRGSDRFAVGLLRYQHLDCDRNTRVFYMLLSFGNLARKTDAMLFRKHLIDRNQRRANQSFNSCLKNKYQEIFTIKLLKTCFSTYLPV